MHLQPRGEGHGQVAWMDGWMDGWIVEAVLCGRPVGYACWHSWYFFWTEPGCTQGKGIVASPLQASEPNSEEKGTTGIFAPIAYPPPSDHLKPLKQNCSIEKEKGPRRQVPEASESSRSIEGERGIRGHSRSYWRGQGRRREVVCRVREGSCFKPLRMLGKGGGSIIAANSGGGEIGGLVVVPTRGEPADRRAMCSGDHTLCGQGLSSLHGGHQIVGSSGPSIAVLSPNWTWCLCRYQIP